MNESTIFNIILVVIVLGFMLERILDWLNASCWSDILPESLKAYYDDAKYKTSQQYFRANQKISLINSVVSFIIILAMLLFNGFALIDQWVNSISQNLIIQSLFFFGIIAFGSSVISFPFDIYDTFVVEQKFGFNTTTIKTYVLDKIKGILLAIILGGGIISLIVLIYEQTGTWFWLLAWGIITIFVLFMAMFYSNLIVPLFNKQVPLQEGELRTAIQDFSEKAGFKLDNIYVINGSKRSSKANAYFSGLGPKKRIVLFDTLIEKHSVKELVAVLAHEIGHYKKHHIRQSLILSVLMTGFTLWLFSWMIENPVLSHALGASKPSFYMGAIAFGILYTPISILTGLLTNKLSRKNEYQADAFAANFDLAEPLQTALIRLSVDNLSNLNPHPWYVALNYSHPTLIQRITALKNSTKPE
jgi:STE24 endopeptidase